MFLAIEAPVPEILEWKRQDLDRILELGDKLHNISFKYRDSSDNSSYLEFNEVYNYIVLDKVVYRISDDSMSTNTSNELEYIRQRNCTVENVIQDLTYFSEKNIKRSIFTCNDFTFAVIFTNGKFVLFDSHKRTTDGDPVNDIFPDGTAVLCINRAIRGLAERLIRNCGLAERLRPSFNFQSSREIFYNLRKIQVDRVTYTEIPHNDYIRVTRNWQIKNDHDQCCGKIK